MSRVAIFCPGRGSYLKESLRSLPGDHAWVDAAEALRAEYGLPSLLELDRAATLGPDHLASEHISPLIYVCTMLDAQAVMEEHETVCVGGNSMGWYTALAVAGVLSFEDGFRLVQEMALLQAEHTDGGQVVYPVMNDDWQPDAARAALVERTGAYVSIRLGGYAVLAGDERDVERLLRELPKADTFPYRLKGHGPFHTPLLAGVAEKAQRLRHLDYRAPAMTLIDGRGRRHTPWSADPDDLARYTVEEQVTTTYDFNAGVRVALREYAPDRLALPGPGNSLGGPCAQVIVAERWNGIASRADFEASPGLVWSLRRP